jgi:hypothetical protein
MTDIELKELVKKNPTSIVAAAYRLGRKEMSLEMTEAQNKYHHQGCWSK